MIVILGRKNQGRGLHKDREPRRSAFPAALTGGKRPSLPPGTCHNWTGFLASLSNMIFFSGDLHIASVYLFLTAFPGPYLWGRWWVGKKVPYSWLV